MGDTPVLATNGNVPFYEWGMSTPWVGDVGPRVGHDGHMAAHHAMGRPFMTTTCVGDTAME